MSAFSSSDFVPFVYEPLRRADRVVRAPAWQTPAADREAAKRLLRSPANPRDLELSSLAVQWCMVFPATQQPLMLCARFPRIANRLALCWTDAALSRRLLGDLLVDRRGHRAGFPPDVQAELESLARGIGLHVGRPARD